MNVPHGIGLFTLFEIGDKATIIIVNKSLGELHIFLFLLGNT